MTRHKILQYTQVAAETLENVALATRVPLLGRISSLSLSIIPLVEALKFQEDRCLQLTDKIHDFLCVLTAACTSPAIVASPKLLEQIVEYSQALQNFRSWLKTHEEFGKIKRIFKQGQILAQLDHCDVELTSALHKFKLNFGFHVIVALTEVETDVEKRHQGLLELLSRQSELHDPASLSDTYSLSSSSTSLSLLPGSPKFFHGRESELRHVLESFVGDFARVVILGPGGMGKTTLAMAVLHDPSIIAKYPVRHLIACESTNNTTDLVRMIGFHLGFEPWTTSRLSQLIVDHLHESGPTMLLLDNFDTPWEPVESRGKAEDFLSLLADISNVALLVTMRGAERPAKVKWSRPFLPALEPLSSAAIRQIFVDTADEPSSEDASALEKLIELSGMLPLAASLMANIAAYEGFSATVSRWNAESTSLVSDGHDKHSNLGKSIALSLNSPRMAAVPHAMALLSLFSLLPDGITREELSVSQIPVPGILQQISSLVGMSLLYLDPNQRLKMLSPISEYLRKMHPPEALIFRPLCRRFQEFLSLCRTHLELKSWELSPKLISHLGNINSIFLHALTKNETALPELGHSILELNYVSVLMSQGSSPLTQSLPGLIEITGSLPLEWEWNCNRLFKREPFLLSAEQADSIIAQCTETLMTTQLPMHLAFELYRSAAKFFIPADLTKATTYSQLALSLSKKTSNTILLRSGFEMKIQIQLYQNDANRALETVAEAQALSVASDLWLVENEIEGRIILGDLLRALQLCHLGELEIEALGLKDSQLGIAILDSEGWIHERKTEFTEARKIYEVIARKTSPARLPRYHRFALSRLAYYDISFTAHETEIPEIPKSYAAYQDVGDSTSTVYSFVAASLHLYIRDTERARAAFEAVVAQCRGVDSITMIRSLAVLGDPKHKLYSLSDTFLWAVVYLAFSCKIRDVIHTLHSLRYLGDIFAAWRELDTALELFKTALDGGTMIDIHKLRAECMIGIGRVLKKHGQITDARSMWESAYPLFIRSSQMKDAGAVKVELEALQSVRSEPRLLV